jgi:capsular polysaccharide biosynthesis protein
MHARFSRPRAPGAHGRRIYIDRAHASLRRVLNNTDVKAALAPHGFEFLALERLNLAQKQALFADAEMVVGPAGAGFANLLFCHPGTQVLVFYQQGFETNSFWSLCNNNRLGHFHLVCAPPQDQPASVHTNTINDDFQIDIDALTRTLECMRARPP